MNEDKMLRINPDSFSDSTSSKDFLMFLSKLLRSVAELYLRLRVGHPKIPMVSEHDLISTIWPFSTSIEVHHEIAGSNIRLSLRNQSNFGTRHF